MAVNDLLVGDGSVEVEAGMTVIGFFSRGRLYLSAGDREVSIELEPAEMMAARRLVMARLTAAGAHIKFLN
jgi:hypothetical protein